jgi:hypothetical protein
VPLRLVGSEMCIRDRISTGKGIWRTREHYFECE